jgi:hypothetical protein
VHTHPGSSAQPSNTDEETFRRCFGTSDWAVMFIVARGGQTYARLRLNAGPGADVILPVEVDFSLPFAAADQAAWASDYQQAVREEQFVAWQPRKERRLGFRRPIVEQLDVASARAPYLDDPFWDDQQFHSLMEGVYDQDRHPF